MESPLFPAQDPSFRLIETFAYLPEQGFQRISYHLDRLSRSAAAFGIPFDPEAADISLLSATGNAPLRCRLTLDAAGQFDLTTSPLTPTASQWIGRISENHVDSQDVWLRHKSTRRALYDHSRANLPSGIDEILFLNEKGAVCEGTITNVFAYMPDGRRLTPPLSCGLLPGILRETLLETGQYEESPLTLSDLKRAKALYVGNSLRGLIPIKLR